MSRSRYDVIVVGVGGMGSAALLEFTRRGLRVVGLEQFAINHERGSSHGETRILRKAYFEHPDYVPLVTMAESGWATIEALSGRRLLTRTGLLLGGPQDGAILSGARRAAADHALAFEPLSPQDLPRRFPGFTGLEGLALLFERDAGFLRVDDCVRACVEQAVALGADVCSGEVVRRWSAAAGGVVVETGSRTFTAGSLALCAGAWTGGLLGDLDVPLEIQRRVVVWMESRDGAYALSAGSPVFGFEIGGHFFYGFPSLDRRSVKVSEHFRSDRVVDPGQVRRRVSDDDTRHIRAFARDHLPGLTDRVVKDSVCLYTMTPDEHFILDRHPQHPNVAIAAGFSGHGFKFAPVVGSVLADLLGDGRTDAPVSWMGLSRFSHGR